MRHYSNTKTLGRQSETSILTGHTQGINRPTKAKLRHTLGIYRAYPWHKDMQAKLIALLVNHGDRRLQNY